MAVVYRPVTVAEYYERVRHVRRIHEEYEAITDSQKAAEFANEHWADLKASVEPPPINALILTEFMESHERMTSHLASALREFGKIPEGKEIPANAITLWKAMIHGFDRVADALTKPPEK